MELKDGGPAAQMEEASPGRPSCVSASAIVCLCKEWRERAIATEIRR